MACLNQGIKQIQQLLLGYRELSREIDRTAVPVGIRDALDRARIAAPGILDVDTIDTRLWQMPAHTLEPFSLVLRPRETEYGSRGLAAS
jgi:hypothetical protein